MTGGEWLTSLRSRGVHLSVEQGRLRVRAPRGTLREEDQEALRRGKPLLMALLEREAAERKELSRSRLSLQQERLWYLDRVEGGLSAYNLSGAFDLSGPLDEAALAEALAAFVERHEVLRLAVREERGEPRADGSAPAALSFRSLDLAEVAGQGRRDEDLRRWLEDEAARVLPVDRPPLIRFTLIRCSAERHVLFVLVHHLVWDGWCFDVFLRDVGELYTAVLGPGQPALPPLLAGYRDFVTWQRDQIAGSRLSRAMEFWDAVLGPNPPRLDLPVDRPRPPLMTYAANRVPLRLEGRLLEAMRRFARSEHATLFIVLLAAFKTLLFRYSGQRDVVVASPVDGRARPEFEDLVGFFVNTLPIRSAPAPGRTFLEFFRQVRDRFLETLRFQDTPFEWLVERYGERDPGRTPLFQAMFAYQHTAGRVTAWGPLRVSSYARGTRTTYTDLSLWVREYEGYVDGGLDYRTDLFDRVTAEGMASGLVRLLEGALDDPARTLDDLPLLGAEEERREISRRAGVAAPELAPAPYLEAVRTRARRHPEREAVQGPGGRSLRYGEVWAAAGRVAAALRESGVRPGAVVGVTVGRSERLVPLLLGIHRARAVYLPLDPELPRARIEYMVEDAGAVLLISDEQDGTAHGARPDAAGPDAEAGPPGPDGPPPGVQVLAAARALQWQPTGPEEERGRAHPSPGELAYLMYTSGSTGRPKAVEVEHGALANFLSSMESVVAPTPDDTWVAVTTVSFDISLLELLFPLCSGGRVVVADAAAARDPAALGELLATSGASVMQATPATWRMLIGEGWDGRLRRILCGGDTFPRELADRLQERADQVWNLYGPTETTIWSTAGRVEAEAGVVPVGRPLENTRVYVLDERGRAVPAGMRGEVWIAGAGLARGYRGRGRLTSDSFVQDPFRPGERMYRTGDLGRWRSDGRLEHLGRVDLQLKVQGFRIEPGEIEAALEGMEEVRQAAVATLGEAEDRRLVAYVVFVPGRSLLAGEVRQRLAATLPRYMIPGVIMALETLPLTPSGKVDRRSLPAPLSTALPSRAYATPEPGIEQAIATVWRDLLGVERVGRHDNFFELGGNSLQSIRAVVEIERRAGRRIDPRTFFFRTLAQLARA